MIRFALYSLALAAVLIVSGWFAVNPGQVTIDWLGWRIGAPVGLLALGVAAVALALALLFHLWLFLVAAPSRIAAWREARRRRRGYLALSRGMVAVAAGETAAARIAARRAGALIAAGETPLPLLLAAQAAQLEGDETQAQHYFTVMLERPETEFLGLRGLLAQAARAGDMPHALRLAQRAYELKPNTPWVSTALFDLLIRQGEWLAAEKIIERADKRHVLPHARAQRYVAILAHAQSLQAERLGHAADALRLARRAHRLVPQMPPLAARLATLLIRDGHKREAAKVIEQTWPHSPQPELARLYGEAKPESDPLKQLGQVEHLAKLAPDHLESRLALARAAMAAGLWGKARSQLAAVTGMGGREDDANAAAGNGIAGDPPARAFRLLAELEEAEHGDAAAARRALERAGFARPDETWTCRDCGARALDWTPLCPGCQAFDTLEWASPRPVAVLAATSGRAGAAGETLAGSGVLSPAAPPSPATSS